MVFYIDQTISAHAEKIGFTQEQLFLFSELVTAFWKGHCIVTGNANSIKTLATCLGAPANGIFATTYDLHSQQGAILSKIPQIFVLTTDESLSETVIPPYVREKSVFINLADAVFWNLHDGCSLVGENLDDCIFYRVLGKKFCEKNGIHGIDLHFSFDPGGGNPTHKIFTNCVTEKKVPTICIVDSDRKYGKFGSCQSDPAIGDTLRLVNGANSMLDTFPHVAPHKIFPLQVHEAENLIPLAVLDNLQSELPQIEPGLKTLEKLKTLCDGEPILYYDFKFGIRYEEDTPRGKYWREIADALGEQFLPVPEEKLTSAQKAGRERLPASPPFYPISNNRLLERATNWIDSNQIEIETHLERTWEQVGSFILSWGCAISPIRG